MKKILLLSASAMLLLSSCVSKKQFTDLEAKQKEIEAREQARRREVVKAAKPLSGPKTINVSSDV